MATLTPRDLEALLAIPPGRGMPLPSLSSVPHARYNFRRPDRISKEQIRALQFLHERFARHVSTSLAAYLRAMTELSLVSVEQFAYSDFLLSLSDPTVYYAVSMSPFDELAALEINPSVGFAMVERMLGGAGQAVVMDRALTDIEQNVIDSVVKILLDSLTETWRPVIDTTFGIRARETRPQMLQVASANDNVLMLTFDMRVGEAHGPLNLCFPASLVEKTHSHFAGAWDRSRNDSTPKERAWLLENLSRVPIAISAVLESRCPARDLSGLAPGDVIALDVPAHQPLDLRVGETLKFRGRLTELAGRARVRIEHRCDGAGAMEA